MKSNDMLFVNSKDVMRITGFIERTACRILVRIRKKNKKDERYGLVTVNEFCEFTGLKTEQVLPYLNK